MMQRNTSPHACRLQALDNPSQAAPRADAYPRATACRPLDLDRQEAKAEDKEPSRGPAGITAARPADITAARPPAVKAAATEEVSMRVSRHNRPTQHNTTQPHNTTGEEGEVMTSPVSARMSDRVCVLHTEGGPWPLPRSRGHPVSRRREAATIHRHHHGKIPPLLLILSPTFVAARLCQCSSKVSDMHVTVEWMCIWPWHGQAPEPPRPSEVSPKGSTTQENASQQQQVSNEVKHDSHAASMNATLRPVLAFHYDKNSCNRV